MRAPALASLAALLGLALSGPTAVRAEDPPAALVLEAPRGGQTRERVIPIRGRLTGARVPRLTLVLNGVPLSIPVSDEGTFETRQVLAPGENQIRVVAEADGRTLEDEVAVHALVPAKDLRITLTWDTPGTDVDLWVTGPDGEKVFYQHTQGAAGGTLDTDVTTGYGPETYTQARTQPGTYRVEAHYYRGDRPSRITVNVLEGEGTPNERRRVFEAVLLETNDVVVAAEFTGSP
jgi:uncharacterized protein YfaP (DUF2135 family)